jgi:hypothetical protein
MNDRTAPPAQASARAAKPHRGGPSGRLTVGEYVGQPAGEAAQAVRRAGLRPGLDRSFGGEPELVGQVVAQEPCAGSDLARNGLVTLYVAAPGVAHPDDAATEKQPASEQPAAVVSAPAAARDEPSPPIARARRRRKPRRAPRTPLVFETPQAPMSPAAGEHSREAPAQDADPDPTQEWENATLVASASAESEEPADELAGEDFVVVADDLFAGRASGALPAWRRVYPRPSSRRLRARLARHPWLAGTAGVMLAVWIVLGVASLLAGHPSSARSASFVHGAAKAAGAQATHASGGSAAGRPKVHRARSVNGARRRGAAPTLVPRARPAGAAAASLSAASAPPPTAPAQVAPVTVSARSSPGPVSPPAAPTPEPSRGGLFSP